MVDLLLEVVVGIVLGAIKESIYIRVRNPTLNQNIGKYNLNHIWDRVLFNTPGLKLGSSQQPSTQP